MVSADYLERSSGVSLPAILCRWQRIFRVDENVAVLVVREGFLDGDSLEPFNKIDKEKDTA
jgi:hypothetical protein